MFSHSEYYGPEKLEECTELIVSLVVIAGPSLGRTFLATLWVGAFFDIVGLGAVFQHIIHCTFNFNLVAMELRFLVT